MKTFDDKLNDEQAAKAAILRKSIKSDFNLKLELKEIDIKYRAKDKLETFDDALTSYVQKSRSLELRKKCKAEIYWEKATKDEKTAIKEAISQDDRFKKNELYLKHFMARSFESMIKDEIVLTYIIRNVLGLE